MGGKGISDLGSLLNLIAALASERKRFEGGYHPGGIQAADPDAIYSIPTYAAPSYSAPTYRAPTVYDDRDFLRLLLKSG